VLDILILKAKYGWSDRSFNDLLTLLVVVLPKPNFVPTNIYQAKKLISALTMGVERIHACPNHYILYYGVFKDLKNCPTCGASGYKRNDNYSEEDMGTNTRKKRKKGRKKNDASQNVVEENNSLAVDDTNQRRIPALVMWYLSPSAPRSVAEASTPPFSYKHGRLLVHASHLRGRVQERLRMVWRWPVPLPPSRHGPLFV
jgi:hypothetical protein